MVSVNEKITYATTEMANQGMRALWQVEGSRDCMPKLILKLSVLYRHLDTRWQFK
jgi:hypothetical protein